MIVAAAICPSPPLLAAPLTGQAEVLPELRAACAAAVARLLAAAPDVVAVAGPAAATGPWDPAAGLSLAAFAPALGAAAPARSPNGERRKAARPAPGPALPLALGIGALLLDEAGYRGPRLLRGVAGDEPAAACLALGRELAAAAPRVALLAVGDGSARRAPSAPGYLDERAAPFDAEVERAVRDGDLPALAALDPALADGLLAAGRPAWQVLAGALAAGELAAGELAADGYPAGRLESEVIYSGAPLGVAYLVATLVPR